MNSALATLVKVTATSDKRAEIMQISDIFRGKIIDVSERTLTIEVTGPSDKVDAFQSLLSPYGIKELVRTGKIALAELGPGFRHRLDWS